jgi:hypothetical protein
VDPDPEGQKLPTKIEKSFEVLDVKGFLCSLDIV